MKPPKKPKRKRASAKKVRRMLAELRYRLYGPPPLKVA